MFSNAVKSLRSNFCGTLFMGIFMLSMLVISSTTQAHPDPDNPFDDTHFAPIEPEGGIQVVLDVVVDEDQGITSPLKGISAPDTGKNLMYVIDQIGKLWAVDLSTTNANNVVVDMASLVPLVDVGGLFGAFSKFDERGFLGFAFHPDYLDDTKAGHARIYTYTSEVFKKANKPTFPSTIDEPDHQAVISEWVVKDPTKDIFELKRKRRVLMRVDEPQFNHDGGDLVFDANNLLYISLGDGGAADDQAPGHNPEIGNAQDNTNPLGAILRIDPLGSSGRGPNSKPYGIPDGNLDQEGALPEIYAYGFRNPYRMSVDSVSGDLFVADVGQNDIEELNLVNEPGNYGWNLKEGTLFFDPNGAGSGFATLDDPGRGAAEADLIEPIAQYDTHHEGHSIIGGFMYRGDAIPQLQDRYVFGDFSGFGFNFVAPAFNNYGRLLVLNKTPSSDGLFKIKNLEFDYLLGEINNIFIAPEDHTLAILGFGIGRDGEIYVLGNVSGTPDTDNKTGVVVKITPTSE